MCKVKGFCHLIKGLEVNMVKSLRLLLKSLRLLQQNLIKVNMVKH